MHESLRTYLTRIAKREREIRAFAWFDAERAERLERWIDESVDRDAALRGMPIGVKDIIDVAGLPTGMGSPLHGDGVAPRNADLVDRLERAGALILGKTATTEFAYFSPGPTRNPWNTAHTPGGSSSGSAAAVAAGFCAAAIGTQTNGSIIRPAAFCGIAGFKPSHGRISTRGVLSWSPTLDTVGIFANRTRDCAEIFTCLGGRRGTRAARWTPRRVAPRLAAVRSPVWHLADAAQRESFFTAIDRLRRRGAEVIEAELPDTFADAHAAHWSIMSREGASYFREIQESSRAQLSRPLNELIDHGATVAAEEYSEALARRDVLQRELGAFLGEFDALLTPPARGEAPATLDSTGDPAFCTIWTLCGTPAICIPAGTGPLGLPLGLQLVGAASRDEDLLATAAWCEEVVQHEP